MNDSNPNQNQTNLTIESSSGHASPAKSDSGGRFEPSYAAAAASSRPAGGVRAVSADPDPHPDGEDRGGRELQQLSEQRVLQRVPPTATEATAAAKRGTGWTVGI